MISAARARALAVAMLLVACGDDGASEPTPSACDARHVPVVMIHGFLEDGGLWLPFTQRFAANGYCADAIYTFAWDPLDDDADHVAALDAFIDGVLASTGKSVVDVVAHSAGGELAYDYLADATRAAKVQGYCHLASAAREAPAGPAEAPVPTANIRSPADPVVPGGDIPGAANLVLTTEDHLQVATSDKAFNAVYQFLGAGQKPTTLLRGDAPPGGTLPRTVSGRAATYGENRPLTGWTVDVFALVAASGERVAATPERTFTVASDGAWGPFEAEVDTGYEIFLHGPGASDLPIHHYRGPFIADARFVQLQAMPSPDSLLRVLFSGIDRADAHAAIIVSTASQAVRSDRDSLTLGALTLATEALAAPARSTTTFFVFDDKADNQSSGQIQQYANLFETTVAGVDQVVPADTTVTITLGTRSMNVPARPSQRDGLVWVTFD